MSPQDADDQDSGKPLNRLQEQFIKQVKDDSLPANQVLTERNEHMQKDDRASDNSTSLFIP
jgi:hypothetical protein